MARGGSILSQAIYDWPVSPNYRRHLHSMMKFELFPGDFCLTVHQLADLIQLTEGLVDGPPVLLESNAPQGYFYAATSSRSLGNTSIVPWPVIASALHPNQKMRCSLGYVPYSLLPTPFSLLSLHPAATMGHTFPTCPGFTNKDGSSKFKDRDQCYSLWVRQFVLMIPVPGQSLITY